ncbi:MAG: hypothetical protein ACPGYK_03450 [Flavobacteriales bacterium]
MKVLNCLCAGLTFVAATSAFMPEANAQVTGLYIEPVGAHTGTVGTSDLTGHTTYRLYATLTSPTDLVQAVFGSAELPLEIATTTQFWQSPIASSAFATGINSTFLSVFPELAYDSWFTVGLDSAPQAGEEGEEPISSIGMSTELGVFEAGSDFLLNSEVGGSYYALPGATNGTAGDDLEVLLGQFTTTGQITGTFNMQVFIEGNPANVQLATESFESPAVIAGCTEPTACNFDPSAAVNDDSCEFPMPGRDCDGNCLADADGDDICDADEIPGCLDVAACNFNPEATDDAPETCEFAEDQYDCDGNCLVDSDGDGICDAFEVPGCTDESACNYNAAATDEDGTCAFPAAEYDCNGNCLADEDQDGICDAFEVPGCTNSDAINYDPAATDDDGSCLLDGEDFCGFGTVWDSASNTCVWDGETGAEPTCQADFTEDGLISIADLLEWLPFYGQSCD